MKKSFPRINLLSLLIITFQINYSQPALSYENSSYTYLKSNLEFLSSDELEGREATSRGEKLAALYISEELEKYGVEPYGDSGGYFQNFEMTITYYSPWSNLSISNKDSTINIQNGTDIVFSSRNYPDEIYSGEEYDLIFAGYGIVSDEDNYNSYESLNVENKVVVALTGIPPNSTSQILSDETQKRFRRSPGSKAEIAKNKGAVGLLLLPNEETLRYWDYYKRGAKRKSFMLKEEFSSSANTADIPILYLNDISSSFLLGNDKNKILDSRKEGNPYPETFSLDSKVKFDYKLNIEDRIARNVIGRIKGSNDFEQGEYVTIGAHYDHLGIQNGEIYNGADDNGSGTVAILEVARLIAGSKGNSRPILIIFHSAEEKGLKGSKYLTNNSEFIDSVMVHINLDMIGRESEDSIFCIGASKISTQLGEIIESVNSNTVNIVLDYKFDDPGDPLRLYYRSDHVHYANRNIPIAFFYDYMKEDYHKPTDTVEKINFVKLVKMTDLLYNITLELSNINTPLVINKASKID